MSYQQYGKIEAADYNALVGTTTTSTTGELNAIWGPGNGNKGYGQTSIAQVDQYSKVTYNNWASLVNTTSTIGSHQNTALTLISAPVQGNKITYSSAITTNLSSVTSSRLNAASQGSTSAYSTSASSWSNQLTFTQTVTFGSGNQARYFFNCGGQILVSFSSPSGTGINALMNSLGVNCGSIVLSSPTSGSVTLGGTAYNGITKMGGGGTAATLSTNTGYYALGTTDTLVFSQAGTGTPAGYIGSYIAVYMRTNGTQGSNGDNGSVITITTVWDEVPNGLVVASGTATTVTIRPPSTTYLANSWGTPTVVGSVTGS
jgi:hypothetical protein